MLTKRRITFGRSSQDITPSGRVVQRVVERTFVSFFATRDFRKIAVELHFGLFKIKCRSEGARSFTRDHFLQIGIKRP